MRALFIHPSNEWYGADQMLYAWAKTLHQAGWVVSTVTPNDLNYSGELETNLKDLGVECAELSIPVLRRRYISLRGLLWMFGTAVKSGRELRRSAASTDVVIFSTCAVLPVAFLLVGVRTQRWIHVQEHLGRTIEGVVLSLIMRLTCDKVVCCSNAVKAGLASFLAPRSVVLQNGLLADTQVRAAVLSDEEAELKLALIGRVQCWKGQLTAIEVLGELVNQNGVPAKLTLVGAEPPGEEGKYFPAIWRRIDELGIGDSVDIRGQCSPAEVEAVVADSHVLFNLSTKPDPFPLATLEAMRAGAIVVASALGGLPEMLRGSGYLAEPDSFKSVVAILVGVAKNRDLARQRSREARETWEQHYSPHAHTIRLRELFASLLGSGHTYDA